MNENLRISVVIPCHNAEPWISDAISSALNQTRPPHEVIVVDDASNDLSIQRITTFNGITLLHAPGGNAARARNIAIRAATGEWVAFLDADDIWFPDHLLNATRLLAHGSDVAYIAMFRPLRDGDATHRLSNTPPTQSSPHATNLSATSYLARELGASPFAHSTVLYRRDRLMEVGSFDEAQLWRHDIDLWLRVVHNHTWTFNPRYSVWHRTQRPGRLSAATVDCDYYYLRALIKNQCLFPTAAYTQLLNQAARRAMRSAFTSPTAHYYNKVKPLAWPFLSRKHRLAYRLTDWLPDWGRHAANLSYTVLSRPIKRPS